ncbi:MAG: hypothetical protein ACRCYU_09510 [Nocardioides sp.]
MTDQIRDLLEVASEDSGVPLGFTPAEISARGRAVRRRRSIWTAAGVGAVAATTVLVATAFAGGLTDHNQPGSARNLDADSATVVDGPGDDTSDRPATVMTDEEQAVFDRCARAGGPDGAYVYPKDVEPELLSKTERDKYAVPPPNITGWTVDAYLSDRHGTTATVVSPDQTRWAVCHLVDRGIESVDELLWSQPIVPGATPAISGDSKVGRPASPNWVQVCNGNENTQVCDRELFYGGGQRYADVAEIVVDAPDGRTIRPVLGDHTYVLRILQHRVAVNRAPDDSQELPSMPVRFLDRAGEVVLAFDYYPSILIPKECLNRPGGC